MPSSPASLTAHRRPSASGTGDVVVDHLAETLSACARDVFETMVGRMLDERTPRPDPVCPAGNIVGTVGFTGSSAGLVVFQTSYEAARAITASLLGSDEEDASSRDDVIDAIGEVTNMIAGSFRTRLAIEGDAWAITVPTVTLGSDFYMTPVTTGRRTVLPFVMDDQDVFVELVLTRRVARQ